MTFRSSIVICCLLFMGTGQATDSMPTTGWQEVAKKALPGFVSIHIKIKEAFYHDWESLSDDCNNGDCEEGNEFEASSKKEDLSIQTVTSLKEKKNTSFNGRASGFIVSKDGYICTCDHVVEVAEELFVVLSNGKRYSAHVVDSDFISDTALLKIDTEEDLPEITFGDSSLLQKGEGLMVIGSPYGLETSVSTGIVSSENRTDLGLLHIQTDATVNGGNSGGPVINSNGEVIGMVSCGLFPWNVGLNFAIPSNTIKKTLDTILSGKSPQHGHLGVITQELDKEVSSALGIELTGGAVVTKIIPGATAYYSDLQEGDVILAINDTPINNPPQLRAAILQSQPETEVTLTVRRFFKTISISIKLGLLDIATHEERSFQQNMGFFVHRPSEDLIITKIDLDGISFKAGLRLNQEIISVNGIEVSSLKEFMSVIKEKDEQENLLIQVFDVDRTQFIILPLPRNPN